MQLQHQKITLDVNDTRAFTVLNAHQGDSKTRFIDITLTENGNTITLSSSYVATVKASINSKTKAVNTAVVDATNNVITVELTKTMLDTPGLLNCEVILQDNQQFVTSATFTVKVAESVISDETEIVASQEFGKLLDALIEIKDIEDKADRVQTLVDNIDKLESADRLKHLAEHGRFNFSATFTSDGVIKNTTSDSILYAGDFATGQNDIGTAYVSNAVTRIGNGTFSNCTSLTTIYVDNTVGNVEIVSGAIPDGVSIVYSNDENFINVNELLASAIKSLKSSVNTTLDTKENVSNKVSEITHPSLDYYPNTEAVFDYVNSELETPLANIESLKADKLDKADFNSYKTSNDNAVNSKVDTTDFNAYKTSTDKCFTDIASNSKSIIKSAGFEVLELEWMEGVIDSATGNVGKSKNNAITDFIPVSILGNCPIYITPQNGCKVYVYKYDANKNYTGIVANGVTTEVVIIPDSPFYRFMLQKTDGTKFPIIIANLCAVSGIKSGALTKELNKLASFTKPSFLLNTKNKIDVEDIFPLIKNYQINGNTGYEFATSKNVMISDFIPVKDSEGNLLVESIEFIFNGNSPSGNAVMFFYDKNKAYLNRQVIADVGSERKTVILSNYPNVSLVRLQYRLDILPFMKIYLNAASGVYEWLKVKRQQIIDDARIDVGKNYYLIKGEPLELFRHGMIRKKYGNYSKPEGDYLISLNNNPGHTSDYLSKLVFNVPTSLNGDKLGNYEPFTSAPCLRLYDLDMKSLSYQYINIYMSDKTKIANKKRNICFFGDSLTAMGYISKHVKDKLHEYGLTNTKLVGVNTNLDDSENRFTATGGYSWDNYTKNPSLLPTNLGNNHLWNPNINDIDFSYFMEKYGNGETINYVVALIGWNDYDMRNTTWKDYATEGISAIERKARKLITRLHEQYPNCHVLLVGYHVSTTQERNMHPNLPYESRNKFVWELNDLYKSFEDEFSFVHFIHTASQFDSYNNMRKNETKPNIYATNKVEMVTDDVHPASEGYYQYGDAELRCLMYLMQNEN